jgi:hypothetical protein
MKLKVTMSFNVSVSEILEIPEKVQVIDGVLPDSVKKQIEEMKEKVLFPKLQEKAKNTRQKVNVRLA